MCVSINAGLLVCLLPYFPCLRLCVVLAAVVPLFALLVVTTTATVVIMSGRQIDRPSVLAAVRPRLNLRYKRFTFELSAESEFVFADCMSYAVIQRVAGRAIGYVEFTKQLTVAAVKCVIGGDSVKPLVHVSRRKCLTAMFDSGVDVVEYGKPSRYDGVRQVHKM